MNKKNLFLIILAIAGIIAASGCCLTFYFNISKSKAGIETEISKFDSYIKYMTSNAKIIDANLDHNQAIDVADFAKSQKVEMPPVLINFDTHSDITLNEDVVVHGAGISNWINEFLAKNSQVKEVYWVMPREEDRNLKLRLWFGANKMEDLPYEALFYGNSVKPDMRLHFLFTPLNKKSYTQNFLIDPKTGNLNEYDKNSYSADILFKPDVEYHKIKITTCTEDTLPDFANKKVFLSIDADYISNSGFDTLENFANIKDEKQVYKALVSMLETIENRNIKPEIINLTLSPQYLPVQNHKQMINFYNRIFKISGQKDAVSVYSRKYKNGFSTNSL